jgi:uncharacterized protein DUF6636
VRVRVLAVGCVAGAVLAAAAAAAASPLHSKTFRTPSRNIGCAYYDASITGTAIFRCDLLSGLHPEPARRCEGDWTGASMSLRGRAGPTCAGDTVYDRRAPILAYGRVWSRAGLTCTSRMTGLTCRNRDGHGFFLARERWRVF